VTERKSSEGAAREFIDYILSNKGIYDKAVQEYLEEISN
jgi:3-deoxy-D-manno-octulosonate 8-phosphate phosphatase KdsC-like HAD superfamily phosphatase